MILKLLLLLGPFAIDISEAISQILAIVWEVVIKLILEGLTLNRSFAYKVVCSVYPKLLDILWLRRAMFSGLSTLFTLFTTFQF